jgi:hypothetical protein
MQTLMVANNANFKVDNYSKFSFGLVITNSKNNQYLTFNIFLLTQIVDFFFHIYRNPQILWGFHYFRAIFKFKAVTKGNETSNIYN